MRDVVAKIVNIDARLYPDMGHIHARFPIQFGKYGFLQITVSRHTNTLRVAGSFTHLGSDGDQAFCRVTRFDAGVIIEAQRIGRAED